MVSAGSASGAFHPRPLEISLSLSSAKELFDVSHSSMFSPAGRIQSGMEELVQELTARRLDAGVRLTLTLPAAEVSPDTEGSVRAAIRRYTALRQRQTELRLKSQNREGLRAVPFGAAVFVISLIGTALLTMRDVPISAQVLLGDGLFVILAWVGLWYPLDLLVHYRRPLMIERRVLQELGAMELILVADHGNGAAPESPDASPPIATGADDTLRRQGSPPTSEARGE